MNSTTSPGFSRAPASATAASPALSVIIVTWNVSDLLADCLQTLVDDDVPSWAEVIVIDNASPDDTVPMVRQRFPWARLVACETNLGFSRANNLGMREARGEWFLLLNPDTLVQRGAIGKLVEFGYANPCAGIVGPSHLTCTGELSFEGASDYPGIWNVFCDLAFLSRMFPKSRIFNGRLLGHWDHTGDRPVPAIPGTAMLIRRQVFEEIGGLDETMFYVEDMDFCLRASCWGWSAHYLGSAAIVHLGGQSSKRTGDFGLQRKIAFQSFWLFMYKNHGPVKAGLLSTMVFLWSLGAVLASIAAKLVWRQGTSAGDTLRAWQTLATSLLAWSVCSKKRFRHHLAAAPQG